MLFLLSESKYSIPVVTSKNFDDIIIINSSQIEKVADRNKESTLPGLMFLFIGSNRHF